jgi:hypothetical protein
MTSSIHLTYELLIPHVIFLIAAVLFIRRRRSVGSILFLVGVVFDILLVRWWRAGSHWVVTDSCAAFG